MCSIMHTVYRYNGMDFADFSCKGLFPRSMTGATDEIIIRDKILFKVYCEKTKKFIETDFATVIEKDIIENTRSIAVKLIRKREDDYNIKDCKDCKIDNCIKHDLVTVYRFNGMDFVNNPGRDIYPLSSITHVTDEMIIRDKIPFLVYCEKTEKFIETYFATVEKDIIETTKSIVVKMIREQEKDNSCNKNNHCIENIDNKISSDDDDAFESKCDCGWECECECACLCECECSIECGGCERYNGLI